MAAGARRINMGILFTNHKLLSIHSESVPRSRSKASMYFTLEKSRVYKYGSEIWSIAYQNKLTLHHAMTTFDAPGKILFENIVEKGEKCW